MQAAAQALLARVEGEMSAIYQSVRCALAWVSVLACSCTGVSVAAPSAEQASAADAGAQSALDASLPDAAQEDAAPPALDAQDAGPSAPAADAGPSDASPAQTPPPAACQPGMPLQTLPEWRDDHGTVLKRIPIENETRGIGRDGQTGLWLLSGAESQAKLVHVDSEGNQLSVDMLQTVAGTLQLGAAAEPLVAGTLDGQAQKLGELSIDTAQQGVYVVRRRSTGFELLGLFEWRGPAPPPLVATVLDAGATGVYVGIQLFGEGTLTPSRGAMPFTNNDAYRYLIALIDSDGNLRFLKTSPDDNSQSEMALADGRLLIASAGKLTAWNDAGETLAQFALPQGDYKPFLSSDAAGNVYAALTFSSVSMLSFGGRTFSANGVSDMLLLKLDARGELSLLKQLGGTGQEQPSGIGLDAQGNVLLTGSFSGATDLGGGPGGLLIGAPGEHGGSLFDLPLVACR